MMFIPALLLLLISQFLAVMEDHFVRRAAHKENRVLTKEMRTFLHAGFLVQSLFTTKTKLREKTHPVLALFTSILQVSTRMLDKGKTEF